MVERLAALGASGVPLGLAHQVLARVCLRAGDVEGFAAAAARCAEVFEHSGNRALVTKYERLMREGRKLRAREHPPDDAADLASDSMTVYLTTCLESCKDEQARAAVAARVLAEHCHASELYLYRTVPPAPELAAQVGQRQPPDALRAAIAEYLLTECARAEAKTAEVDPASQLHETEPASERAVLTDDTGTRYYASLIAHHESAGYVINGVVVQAVPPSAMFHSPGRLACEVSRLALDPGPGVARTIAHENAGSAPVQAFSARCGGSAPAARRA